MEKDYSNLHRGLVLKYFWKVVRNHKISFFAVIIFTILASALDIYIPFQYLKLWNTLSDNSFKLVYLAQNIIILILIFLI